MHAYGCLCFLLSASFCFSLPRLGQETSDVAEMEETGTEKAGKVLLVFSVGFVDRGKEPKRTFFFPNTGVSVLIDFWPSNLECCWSAACLPVV